MASDVRLPDGTYDLSAGIDSGRVTTVQSASNPNGLTRQQLAWLTNGTVRGGGILQRTGFQPLVAVIVGTPEADAGTPESGLVNPPKSAITVKGPTPLFQGEYLYGPVGANPYLIASIGGHIYQILVEAPFTVTDLSVKFNLFNPATPTMVFMEQAEQFLIIQAGDGANPKPTLPLFWDGNILRRSVGIISANNIPGGATPFNEIPAAGPMVYYMGRLWYAQGRKYTAGDIVDGPSGSAQYQLSDSVLKVTENPLALGGDGFTVPSVAGNITGMAFTSNLDTSFGQGPLYVFTRRQVYSLNVPITRTLWIAANNNNQPTQTVAQFKFGSVGDRCIVHVNGDLFYTSLEPSIRSLFISTRYFNQWGNKQISRPINRVLAFNNRALMPTSTGIQFDNRLLMGILPTQTPVGVAFQAIAPLDFDVISGFGKEGEDLPPCWEGMYEGMDILQLTEGDFGGLQRAFATIHSRVDGGIEVWELTNFSKTDNGDTRVTWYFETPAFTWGKEFDLKKLDGAELWIDKISGTVHMNFEYREDANPCWTQWFQTTFCSVRNSCESVANPVCYPTTPRCELGKFPITLPRPQPGKRSALNDRPSDVGYQFQMRVTITGWCRVRGMILFAVPVDKAPFTGLK